MSKSVQNWKYSVAGEPTSKPALNKSNEHEKSTHCNFSILLLQR